MGIQKRSLCLLNLKSLKKKEKKPAGINVFSLVFAASSKNNFCVGILSQLMLWTFGNSVLSFNF